jgi:hypothetical protein
MSRVALDDIIDYTKISQDVELASAFDVLKKDPVRYTQFLQDQQNKVYSEIVKQKDNSFDKVYGDLDRASKVQESILMNQKRTKELANIHKQLAENQQQSASAILHDKQIANRKYEMNEWSVNNKNDTLFVFSSGFIMLSGLLLITALYRIGMISSYLWVALGAPLIIIFILIVVRRAFYTDRLRNKRYWNKQIFPGKNEKTTTMPSCSDIESGIQSGIQSMSSISQNVSSVIPQM